MMLTLIQSAKLNDIDLLAYLTNVLVHCITCCDGNGCQQEVPLSWRPHTSPDTKQIHHSTWCAAAAYEQPQLGS